jgi:hypothetical protein
MYEDLGKGFGVFLYLTFFLFIPLAIWKIIDIIYYLFNHISISFK